MTMNPRDFSGIGLVPIVAMVGALTPGLYAQQQGVEELTRGPVHEAFAASISYNPEAGIVVKTAPPRLIEEIPPDQRPVGDNISWIPGYWGWDDDTDTYVWISGIWRNLPPGRQWMPGYWGEVSTGWQWTSGYWADEQQQEVVYLPKPPESVETGPTVEAPDNDHVWVSGSWVYRDERYLWRPGYWDRAQENWTWVPSSYRWTPRGYVFVDGYWDYDVETRGVVFAPVRFQREVYERDNYYYTPSTVITIGAVLNHLFVRPDYCHYYFGDYYEPRYRDRGYYASYSYMPGRRGYDPIYVHNRWKHRDDRDWDRKRKEDFEYYRDHRDERPARTWADYRSRPEDRRGGRRGDGDFAQPFSRFVGQREDRDDKRPDRFKFQEFSKGDRDRLVERRKEMQTFGRERQRIEKIDDREGGERRNASIGEKLMRSPVIAKKVDELRGVNSPPARREPSRDDRSSARDRDERGRDPRDGSRPDADPRKSGERPDGRRDQPDPAAARRQQEEAERARAVARGENADSRGTREPGKVRRPEGDTRKPDEQPGERGQPDRPQDRMAPGRTTEERQPKANEPPQRREQPVPRKEPESPVTRREEPAPQRSTERKQQERAPEVTRRPETAPQRPTERKEPEQRREVTPQRKEPERPRPQEARKQEPERRQAAPKPEPVRKEPERAQRSAAPERKAPERQPEQRKQPSPQQSRGKGGAEKDEKSDKGR